MTKLILGALIRFMRDLMQKTFYLFFFVFIAVIDPQSKEMLFWWVLVILFFHEAFDVADKFLIKEKERVKNEQDKLFNSCGYSQKTNSREKRHDDILL